MSSDGAGSLQFLGWVFSTGNDVAITAPEAVAAEYNRELSDRIN